MRTVLVPALMAALLALSGCGGDSSPAQDKDLKYTGDWKQSGSVKVRNANLYDLDLQSADGTVFTLRMCPGSANWSIKEGMVIDIKWRNINQFHTLDNSCDQYDSYRIIKDVKAEE